MDKYLVSIITPCYNGERFISHCIKSVLAQTYKNWEMIIVDDNSQDNSKKIINSLTENDSRISSIYLENNVGAAEARNIAITRAKGRFIAFLDSDDLWHREKLEIQIAFMLNRSIGFSYTSYEIINYDGMKTKKIITAPNKIGYNSYLKNTIIGCLTVVLDKSIVGDFKMPNIRSSHDMALWLSILKRGIYAYGIKKKLSYYRIVETSNTSNKIKAAIDVWKVYRNVEKLSFIYSLICFFSYTFNAIKKRL